ncbi:MAG: hypothetical protein ABI868_05960 [Acidobacteriota bacterium]
MMSSKQAISVTLGADNVTWLKGRAGAGGVRSLSQFLDQLVTAARQGGRVGPATSVVGTIDIDSSDPLLAGADAALQAIYEASLGRPLAVRAAAAQHAGQPARRRSAK